MDKEIRFNRISELEEEIFNESNIYKLKEKEDVKQKRLYDMHAKN